MIKKNYINILLIFMNLIFMIIQKNFTKIKGVIFHLLIVIDVEEKVIQKKNVLQNLINLGIHYFKISLMIYV